MKIRNGFVSNSSSSSFCIFGVELTEKEYKALIAKEIAAMKEEEGEDFDEESCDIQDMLSECAYIKKNKLDIVSTSLDGVSLCIGLDLSDSSLKGEKLIIELTRIHNILNRDYSHEVEIFSGETYN